MLKVLLTVAILMIAFGSTALADEWSETLLAERAQVDSILAVRPTSPFAAIGQTVLKPNLPLRVILAADTLLLGHQSADPGLPQLEFTWKQDAGVIYVRSPQGGDFKLNATKIGPIPLEVTRQDVVIAEKFQLKAYASTKSARVRAFDPNGYGQSHFHGLNWYDPNPAFVVKAQIERVEADTVIMPTSAGLTQEYVRHSKLHFTIDGHPLVLTMFAPASNPEAYGFIPYTDMTTSEDTYGAGRYIDLKLPSADQTELELDFNVAYNPLCAYVPHYNCPIPPIENDLSVKIEAGEMIYEKH
jgi:uncharacterized protein